MTWKKYSKHHIVLNDKACQRHSKKITRPHLSSHGAKLNFVVEMWWSKHSCTPQQCARQIFTKLVQSGEALARGVQGSGLPPSHDQDDL